MNEPLITFIVPIYNRAKYISKCIESIINQTFTDIEIILIDDGSTDSSYSICQKYEQNDSRIKLIQQENSGVSVARNKGINLANGKYIIFVDSDDYIEEKLSEKIILKLKEIGNLDLFIYGFINEDTNYKVQFYETSDYEINDFSIFIKCYGDLLEKNLLRSPVNKLYSTEILKKNLLFFNEEARIAEDAIFNINYLQFVNKLFITTTPYYHIVNHDSEGRLTLSYNPNNLELQNTFFTKVIDYLQKNNSLTEQNSNILCKQYNHILYKHLLSVLKQDNYIVILEQQHSYLIEKLIFSSGGYFIEQKINQAYFNKNFSEVYNLCTNKYKQRKFIALNDKKYFKAFLYAILSVMKKN